MRRVLSLFIIFIYLFTGLSVFAEGEIFHGHAQKDDEAVKIRDELFTGSVENLERNDVIHMSVSQVLDGSYSFEGDEFFANVVNDVSGESGVIIPKGTVAHGKIKRTSEAKRLGRDGYIDLEFDYLITPDGREIPIDGKMSTKMHPIKSVSKIVATDVGYTAAGGVIGGIAALNILGIEAAIASNGYTLAGGAAIGGAVGLGMSLYRKGKDVLIAPGDEIKVKIKTEIPLPVYKESALRQEEIEFPGLSVRINNVIYEEDPFGEVNTLTLSLSIANMSKTTFSGMDMALVNDYNVVFNPSIFGDTKIFFAQIKPGDRIAGKMSFSVSNVKDSFWLTFYDRRTKKPVAKISVDNAYKKVSKKTKKHNEKVKSRGKKDFYKEDVFNI